MLNTEENQILEEDNLYENPFANKGFNTKKKKPAAKKPTQKELDKVWGKTSVGSDVILGTSKLMESSMPAKKIRKNPTIDWKAVASTTESDLNALISEVGGKKEEFDIMQPVKAEKAKKAAKQAKSDQESFDVRMEGVKTRVSEAIDNDPNAVNPNDFKELDEADLASKLNSKFNKLGVKFEGRLLGDGIKITPMLGYEGGMPPTYSVDIKQKDAYKQVEEIINSLKSEDFLEVAKASNKELVPKLKKKLSEIEIDPKKQAQMYKQQELAKFQELASPGIGSILKGELKDSDFDSPAQKKRFEEWKITGKIPAIAINDIKNWNKQRITKAIDKYSYEQGGNLNENQRIGRAVVLEDYKNSLTPSFEKFVEDSKKYNKDSEEYSKLVSKYNAKPTKEGYDFLKAMSLDLINRHENLSTRFRENNIKQTELEEFTAKAIDPSIKNFKANYNRLEQLVTGYKTLGTNLIIGVKDVASTIQSGITGEKQNDIMKRDSLGVVQLARELKKESEKYQKAVEVDEIDSWQTAGNWIAGAVTNFIPSATMAMTGQAALPLFFASGYGDAATTKALAQQDAASRLEFNYNALKTETNPSELARIQKEIDDDKKILNIPEWKELSDNVIKGVGEAVFEYVGTLSIMKGIGKGLSFMPPKSIKDGLLKATKETLKNTGKEGLSEFGTTLVQNASDAYFLDSGKNLFEGGLESFAQGALMGGGMSAVNGSSFVKQAVFSELATKAQQKRSTEIVKKISELTGVNAYANNQSIPLEKQSPEVQKLIDDLINENEAIKTEVISRLGSDIDIQTAHRIGEINYKARELQKDFKNVSLDPTVELDQLDKAKEIYRKKWNDLMNEKEQLLSGEGTGNVSLKERYDRSFDFTAQQGFQTYSARFNQKARESVESIFDGMSNENKNSYITQAKQNALENESKNLTEKEAYEAAKQTFINKHYETKINEGRKNAENYARVNNVNIEFKVAEGDNANDSAIASVKEALLSSNDYSAGGKLNSKGEQALSEATKEINSGSFEGVNIPVGNKSVVVVHMPNSIKRGRVGVFAHEVLHANIRNVLKLNVNENIKEQGKKLLDYLEKNDKQAFARLNYRLEAYKDKEGNITNYEEVMNTFSDGLAEGTISSKPGAIDAGKNLLNSILESVPGVNFRFKEREDVYQTIVNYNKAAHFGKGNDISDYSSGIEGSRDILFSKSIEEKRDELEERLANDEIDFDRFEELMEKLDIEEKEAKSPQPKPEIKKEEKPVVDKEESDAEKIVKDNKGTVASDKVQAIYDTKGVDGAFDIIKLFKPIVSKLVDKRRDAPGFDKELLTDEIETGKNGLFDLIKAYDPNSGVPLAAYVNKYLPVRAIEASRRILAKEFSKDIDEGTTSYNDSMDDDYSFDSTLDEMREEEERQSGLINPLDIMGETLSAEYISKVESVVETMSAEDLGKMTFANLNDLAPEVTAQFFGITVAKVTNSAANLATPEIAPIQQIIFDNKVKLIKLLPEGAILEGTPARESLIGTGLSIPRKIQSEFYDQKDRLSKGAGLIPYQLKKNITYGDFLKAFGINEDGTFAAFGGKDPRAQTILAMVRLYGKIASNTAVRMTAAQSLEQQADLKAGASKIQFSKSIIDGAYEDLGLPYDMDLSRVNSNSKSYTSNINQVLADNGYENLPELSNKAIGKQNFSYTALLKQISMRDNFVKTLPEVLWSDKGLTRSLLGMHYRTDASGYNFISNKYKKLIDEDGKVVEDKRLLQKIVNLQRAESFNKNLSVKQKGISQRARRLAVEIEKLKSKLTKTNSNYTSITSSKLNPIKRILVEDSNNIEAIEAATKKLTDFDAINKAKAELFIESLRAWVHKEGLNSKQKEERIHSVGIMFTGNANIINGFRALASTSGIIVNTKSNNPNYTVEHEDAVINVVSDIFKKIINNEQNIEFNSTAIIVPKEIADLRNDNADLKLSDALQYNNFKKGVLNTSKGKYKEISFSKDVGDSGIQFSKSLNEDFNEILEETQGIGKDEEFSNITARTQGSGKGKFRFFVPPSAEDFAGLLYDFLGKGKKGEEHFEFFKTNLISPYTKGIQRIDNIRANIKEGYKALKAEYPAESKKLKKKVEGKEFTYDQAVRVYLWKANDITVPGLSEREVLAMSNTVKRDAKLREFADKLSVASGQLKGWVEPTEYWNVESIVSDLHNATEKIGRRNILGEFIENSEQIFSPENLNKIEAALGTNYRSALEDSLFRMKNGSNQTSTDKFSGGFVSWIANANGTIMFLNTRSAILQTIAATNYLNWTDNNPVAASAAFLNQPQYWKDFAMIFNSNKLKERREGLKADVNEAEIANAVKGSKNKAKAALSYLLKIGYTPTQIADSFAIAAGGSTFYRNRVKTYEKQGLTTQEAEEKAFEDFDNATEESQQSSDPSKLSQQQASTAGRLILAFANTPMQYNRLMKKAFRDLINKRGDAKTNVSKILYYGAVQNIIFSALQNALFATLFDDEEEDEKTAKANERKYANILNGMADTILRGTGITGAIVSTAKNTLTRFFEEREKGFKGDQAKTIVAALGISPPIGSKAAKLYSAINTEKIDKDIIAKRGMDVTLDGQLNLSPSYDIAGKVVASTTNFPLDRVVDKVNNVAEVLDSRNKTWQRVALALGWKAFDVGTLNEGEDLIRAEAKAERKEASSLEAAKSRIVKKDKLRRRLENMTSEEEEFYYDSIAKAKDAKRERRIKLYEQTESFRDSIENAKD